MDEGLGRDNYGQCTSLTFMVLGPFLLSYLVTSIPSNLLSTNGDRFYLKFRFTNSDKQEDPSEFPQPSLGETILQSLSNDVAYSDVSFVFDTDVLSGSQNNVLHGHKSILSQ